jgi:hypothetical protein
LRSVAAPQQSAKSGPKFLPIFHESGFNLFSLWSTRILMIANPSVSSTLQDSKVDIKVKLAALWIATMFCYIYGDYFELYVPGKLSSMLEGKMLPLGPVTQAMLVGTSTMMAIQAAMIFLSLVAPAAFNKWLNVVLALVFSLVVALVITRGGWTFYKLLGGLEIVLLLVVVWQAWNWPKQASVSQEK